ncbi:vitamin K epoxide reductase family protein [Bacteroides acidifaciens]|uniref:vitamin K epoxide reductase family protein n=1 Tax=Bacteroides acidifaciens TaxID=85831 RepID=UPI0025582224|nr:vitamin K epoxide reductase family protein [Bacteroides acidifaciens]
MGRHWDGVVIYTTDHQINLHFRTTIGIILSVITCLGLLVLFKTNILNIEILFYSPLILGFAISCCLYLKSEMADGGMIDKLCHISKVADCKRVEDSKYSSVFDFKMDCLAFSFFIAQVICVSVSYLFGISDVLYPLYFISTVISFPTIAYSVYGQLKVRNICPLCVIVALCIATEAVMFICWDNQETNMSVIILYGCIFLISLATLQYNSNIRNKVNDLFADSINLLKLKRKKEIVLIESTLTKPMNSPIGFGNETSTSNVTTIISPSCNQCRKVMSEFIALRQKGLDFKWNIILGQTTPADGDIIEEWINRFLTDKKKFFDDLILWSNGVAQMSPPISQNPIKDTDSFRIRQSFDRQIADLNITGFPKIILNNRLLSSIYTSSDIEFLITDENIIQ